MPNPNKSVSNASNRGGFLAALGLGMVQGRRDISVVTLSGVVPDRDTLTIAGDVFEVVDLSTDSTFDAETDFNNTNAETLITRVAHATFTLGQYVALESEIMRVISVSTDQIGFKRGVAGTTIAAHATGTDPLEIFSGTALTADAITVPVLDDVATDALDRLVAQVTEFSTKKYEFRKVSATVGLIVSTVEGARADAVTETLTNGTVTAAGYNGADEAMQVLYAEQRTPTAAEVTDGLLHFVLPTGLVANTVIVNILNSSDVVLAWDGAIDYTNRALGIISLDNAGVVDWTATDTVNVLIVCDVVDMIAAQQR